MESSSVPKEAEGSVEDDESSIQENSTEVSKQATDCLIPDENQSTSNEHKIDPDESNQHNEKAMGEEAMQEYKEDSKVSESEENGNQNAIEVDLSGDQEKASEHHEGSEDQNMSEDPITVKSVTPRKAKKRGIFVSYSPEATFEEKRFISYTVKELKNLGFSDDIWFDKDECIIGSPSCSQHRLEIVEKCRAALVFVSNSYLNCKSCQCESAVLLSRQESESNDTSSEDRARTVRLFCINYNVPNLPSDYHSLEDVVDLTLDTLAFASVAEKSSAVVGGFSEEIEKYALMYGTGMSTFDEHEGNYKDRKVYNWDVNDVQDWLNSMKIHQRFCLAFEENQIDGFLLLSLTDGDLENHLMVDSKVVRRKLLQQLNGILEKENKGLDRWYMKLRKLKIKDDSIYIIFDPTDVRFMERLKTDLVKKNLQIFHHERLGQSKEEFLQLNGSHLASSHHIILLMTPESAKSLFVYNELLFASWLGKPIVVAMAKNSWNAMRLNMQALLGNCSAVDFETKAYSESLDVLLYHIKPLRHMPAVILEQDFLDRMVDGMKPLQVLVNNIDSNFNEVCDSPSHPKIFLSYHWDVQSKVEKLAQHLESQGFDCCMDVNMVSSPRRLSSQDSQTDVSNDNLQSQIQRKMKSSSVVVCCITHKYICSENCSNDLNLANTLSKPIVPLMFQWMAWPPDGLAFKVRKILAPLHVIDMSNDKLFKKNLSVVITQSKKHHSSPGSSRECKKTVKTGVNYH